MLHARYDPHETTRPARRAFNQRFLDQVDPEGRLPERERHRRAEAARRAYFTRLAHALRVAYGRAMEDARAQPAKVRAEHQRRGPPRDRAGIGDRRRARAGRCARDPARRTATDGVGLAPPRGPKPLPDHRLPRTLEPGHRRAAGVLQFRVLVGPRVPPDRPDRSTPTTDRDRSNAGDLPIACPGPTTAERTSGLPSRETSPGPRSGARSSPG